jgi:hypothetical protein
LYGSPPPPHIIATVEDALRCPRSVVTATRPVSDVERNCASDSAVTIATGYGLDDRGSEFESR